MNTPLKKNLETWIQNGLLTQQQVDNILAFENSTHPSSNKSLGSQIILFGFLILGVIAISIGIISIIAANWTEISDSVKIGVMFATLATISASAFWADSKGKNILFEVLQIFLALFCLASIALIGQIFHTGGQLYQALIFWLLIISNLAFISQRSFLPILWTTTLIVTIFAWIFNEHSLWGELFAHHDSGIIISIICVCFLIATLAGLTSQSKKFSFFTNGFNWWLHAFSLAVLISNDLIVSEFRHLYNFKNVFFVLIILFPLAVGSTFFRKGILKREKIFLNLFFTLSILLYFPFLIDNELGTEKHRLLGAVYFTFAAVLLALYHAAGGRFRFFHAMTILVGLRLLVVYFQVFGNLTETGLGLVATGVIIMGITTIWFKFRERIENAIKGLV